MQIEPGLDDPFIMLASAAANLVGWASRLREAQGLTWQSVAADTFRERLAELGEQEVRATDQLAALRESLWRIEALQ
ncbi:MAG: hypothetical protein FWG11_01990 [Promicromonosporaceae bacterium]|nr:hypothetical protein [Promicromonosporaceae bacterium]